MQSFHKESDKFTQLMEKNEANNKEKSSNKVELKPKTSRSFNLEKKTGIHKQKQSKDQSLEQQQRLLFDMSLWLH